MHPDLLADISRQETIDYLLQCAEGSLYLIWEAHAPYFHHKHVAKLKRLLRPGGYLIFGNDLEKNIDICRQARLSTVVREAFPHSIDLRRSHASCFLGHAIESRACQTGGRLQKRKFEFV